MQPASSRLSYRRVLSDIPQHEPDGFLKLDDTVAEPPKRLSSNKIKEIQIRGNAQEVKTTMEACLQVHRFDRAIALLRQLQIIVHPKSAYLREAFNDCLYAMVMDMIVNKNRKNVDLINQWLEVDMHNAGVEPDARTYALKVKVALATMAGTKRDRTVRRYWELARQDESLGGFGDGFVVVCTERGRAMVAVSAPKLAASIAQPVFDGLLLKAYPSRRVEIWWPSHSRIQSMGCSGSSVVVL